MVRIVLSVIAVVAGFAVSFYFMLGAGAILLFGKNPTVFQEIELLLALILFVSCVMLLAVHDNAERVAKALSPPKPAPKPLPSNVVEPPPFPRAQVQPEYQEPRQKRTER